MPIKIANYSINPVNAKQIQDAFNPLDARTIWEKIKNWFGFGQESTVIPLIKNTFFNDETSKLDKILGFCKLEDLTTGNEYKKNFLIEKNGDEIICSIKLDKNPDGEKISFSYNINDIDNDLKSITDIIIALKKNTFDDFIFDAIATWVEKDKNDDIKKEVIFDLINNKIEIKSESENEFEIKSENKVEIKSENKFDRKFILENRLYKRATFDCDQFSDEFKTLIEDERKKATEDGNKLLDKIKDELFNDLSRMSLKIDGTPIADKRDIPQGADEYAFKKSEFDKLESKLESKFEGLDETDMELIYSLLYQKGLLQFKIFLIKQDPLAGLVNVPYSAETSIEVTTDASRKKIKIKIENEKLLKDISTNDKENIDNLITLELPYVNEQHCNLINLVSKEIIGTPFLLDRYMETAGKFTPDILTLLSVGSNVVLEDKTKLILEYDLNSKTLVLENESEYEYAILNY